MATEKITISKASLLKAYREAEPWQQELLKKLFGPDTFAISFNVMDRIKTFQDAVAELGNDNPLVWEYNQFYSEFGNLMGKDIIAYLKLRIITAALNEGWEPQYTNDEYRYYPFFILLPKEEHDALNDDEKQHCVGCSSNSANACGGLSYYSSAHDGSTYRNSAVGMRLAFKTKELAEYAGKQFLNLWADFVFKNPATSEPFCAAP